MAKKKLNPYKPGFVESELTRIASEPQRLSSTDLRHAVGILAAGMCLILDKLAQGKSVEAMTALTRAAWFLGNWLAQIVWAFRVGYRDGLCLRPGSRPALTQGATRNE